jgi:hypothetical protein
LRAPLNTSAASEPSLRLFELWRTYLATDIEQCLYPSHPLCLLEECVSCSDDVFHRSQPAHKRQKSSASTTSPTRMSAQIPANLLTLASDDSSFQPATSPTLTSSRKRRISQPASSTPGTFPSAPASRAGVTAAALAAPTTHMVAAPTDPAHQTPTTTMKKKGRTNTPWTPGEEQTLQQMRGENKGWSEIAKVIETFGKKSGSTGYC